MSFGSSAIHHAVSAVSSSLVAQAMQAERSPIKAAEPLPVTQGFGGERVTGSNVTAYPEPTPPERCYGPVSKDDLMKCTKDELFIFAQQHKAKYAIRWTKEKVIAAILSARQNAN